MAGGFSLGITLSGLEPGGGFDREIQRLLSQIIPLFMEKVAVEMTAAMARELRYSPRPGRRPNPPNSKTGKGAGNMRYTLRNVNNRQVEIQIYSEPYIAILQEAGWDMVTPAWKKTSGKIQGFMNEAVREVQGRS